MKKANLTFSFEPNVVSVIPKDLTRKNVNVRIMKAVIKAKITLLIEYFNIFLTPFHLFIKTN